MGHFVFDPLIFVQPGYEKAGGDWGEDATQIAQIRADHPELAEWGDLAIGLAWGEYSQDILAVSWVDWITGRDVDFLAYLYVRQIAPGFDFGGTGLFDLEVMELGRQTPWLQETHTAPIWAQRRNRAPQQKGEAK
jgi:hypothetical protein